MAIGSGRRKEEKDEEGDAEEEEYEVQDPRDTNEASRGSHLTLLANELGLDSTQRRYSRETVINGIKGLVIHPNNRWYHAWQQFILVWAVYSSFFTPMEFGFFRGLPKNLLFLDIAGQIAFLFDIALQFFVAYRDSQTYNMVYKHTPIALRYLKSHFILDLLSCMPWDIIYKACGDKEELRFFLWIRLTRVRKVFDFFQNMEKDVRINYLFSRIVKLLAVELYCTHTAACFFYYLATTLPPEQEGYTWIGSLKMGDYTYSNFREIEIGKRYTTSLYFAIVTMATVDDRNYLKLMVASEKVGLNAAISLLAFYGESYGDVHAVNLREMIFIMVFLSFDMVLGAYLIGNITALIVKGSKTERYRDKMADVMKYMNQNRLGRDVRNQVKGHLRLQYESSCTDAAVLQEIPISIRAKISQTLYRSYIQDVSLFKGCSSEFINQIVIRVHEEFFLPGEVIMEQGNAVDQLYVVCHGVLEEGGISEDGSEETVSLLKTNSLFGEVSILCNIPQPYTVRVRELCRLLRLDKQSFSNILDIYFHDGRKILNNLLEGKQSDVRMKQLESDITLHIGKQETELALRVNSSAYHGDLYQLKSLIRAGADPNKKDYDGRSPLHLAASRGYEDIALFLIQEGVDINIPDNFGSTPLLEAIKSGHEKVVSMLVKEGASLNIDDAGSFLCALVGKGDSEFLKRILANGIDPNSKDYDHRTPLHVAASQGLFLMAKFLLEAGASVFSKDRWGNTPLDEGRMCGNKNMIKLLEEAKCSQLAELPDQSQEITDKTRPRKCTVFPFHPSEHKENRRYGIMLWVPHTLDELVKTAQDKLGSPCNSFIVSEDAGKILDADMITDGQKLYLVSETQLI
ncbi:hypothetical protein RJ639_045592 [Escallonia herrerae]|uniref:Potassium channel n=1 Tax=Escallonia herrerae TaxID=1293975 RepID=A0AA89B3L1_9ASTE|nr:hypothetical protein RJ639_045592 [Escallonia herrerae]